MAAIPVALVGIGKIARDQHIPSINDSAEFTLAATVSRSGTVDGVEAFTDLEAMLSARPDIPVISLALPPVPRFDYAVRALEAGRHVMLEKPPGATLSECHALERLAQDRGLTLFATWHSREAEKVDAAKAWLKDKKLHRLTVTWKEDVRRWHPGQEWVFEPGGLGVFDPGINALSIVTRILPCDIHLSAAVLKFPQNRQTPIAADLTFRHPGGVEVSAVFDWRQEGPQTWTIEAHTDAGTLCLTDGGAQATIDGEAVASGTDALSGEYPRLYARMHALVSSGRSEVDLSPMRHVADAFLLGRRETVAAFEF